MPANNPFQLHKTTFDELCDGLATDGKYDHLRLFLTKNNNHEFGQYYLMVSRSSFDKVKLIEVDFRDNHIYVELQYCANGWFKHISFDIDDTKFMFILVSWDDVKRMVKEENNFTASNDTLLELEL